MEDVSEILLSALIPAIAAATGKNVYTRMPKYEELQYPYIYVSDIYINEDGPKTSYMYRVDLMVQVVHLNLTSLKPLFEDKNNIMGLINNRVPFEIEPPHRLLSCQLGSSSNTEGQSELGTENIGIIRLNFTII